MEQGTEEDPKAALAEILNELQDAPGYVVFAAKLTTKDGGLLSLDMKYRRYHLNLEDLKEVFKMCRQQVQQDLLADTNE